MKTLLQVLLLTLFTEFVHGHGFTTSTLEETHGQVEHIFAVKVTKVTKPQKEYTGEKSYPIEIEYELIEILKGGKISKTKAIYTLPAIQRTLPDGQVMRVWLNTLASGKELSVAKGESYLLYAQKNGVREDDAAVFIVRIDPISDKPELVELLSKKE